MANDVEIWHVEDFAKATGLDHKTVHDMELFVLKDALKFNILIPESQLNLEIANFTKQLQE